MKHNHCVACGNADNLQQHHLIPHSLGGSDDGNNLLTLCGSCHAKAHQVQANWRQSELTKSALQAKKARGERTGSIPYGFQLADDGVHLIEDVNEQAALSLIRTLNATGLSFRAIADRLGKAGYSPRGKAWHPQTISNILKVAA